MHFTMPAGTDNQAETPSASEGRNDAPRVNGSHPGA